jgi:hypothetical protein
VLAQHLVRALVVGLPGGVGRQLGGVAGGLDHRDQLGRGHRPRVRHRGLLGRVVDRGPHAGDLVQLALDAVGAGTAGHAADGQISAGRRFLLLDLVEGRRAQWSIPGMSVMSWPWCGSTVTMVVLSTRPAPQAAPPASTSTSRNSAIRRRASEVNPGAAVEAGEATTGP